VIVSRCRQIRSVATGWPNATASRLASSGEINLKKPGLQARLPFSGGITAAAR